MGSMRLSWTIPAKIQIKPGKISESIYKTLGLNSLANASLVATKALAHRLHNLKRPPRGPKWPMGSGNGSTSRFGHLDQISLKIVFDV